MIEAEQKDEDWIVDCNKTISFAAGKSKVNSVFHAASDQVQLSVGPEQHVDPKAVAEHEKMVRLFVALSALGVAQSALVPNLNAVKAKGASEWMRTFLPGMLGLAANLPLWVYGVWKKKSADVIKRELPNNGAWLKLSATSDDRIKGTAVLDANKSVEVGKEKATELTLGHEGATVTISGSKIKLNATGNDVTINGSKIKLG